jgi:phosphonate transport system substrate-binding protein
VQIPIPQRLMSKLALLLAALLPAFLSVPSLGAARDLILRVHPYLAPTEIERRFKPLSGYLGRHLGRIVKVRVSADYDAHLRALETDRCDLAYLGPSLYIKATADLDGLPLLARLLVDGRPYFHGIVVKHRDSPIANLADLKGRRFAFGDPESTMSYYLPRYMLHKAGVALNDLAGYAFLGHHDDVAVAVMAGDFDAGGVKEEVYEKFKRRGMVALAVSEPISEHVFVACRGMAPERVETIRRLMLEMALDPRGMEALRSIKQSVTGLGPVVDVDYDNLRHIVDTVDRLEADQ